MLKDKVRENMQEVRRIMLHGCNILLEKGGWSDFTTKAFQLRLFFYTNLSYITTSTFNKLQSQQYVPYSWIWQKFTLLLVLWTFDVFWIGLVVWSNVKCNVMSTYWFSLSISAIYDFLFKSFNDIIN